MVTEAEIRKIVEEVVNRLGVGTVPAPEPPGAGAPGGEDGGLPDLAAYDLKGKVFMREPLHLDGLIQLKKTTPARIGVDRAGPRPLTEVWLRFRADHAAAKDAVWGEVDEGLMEEMDLFCVKSAATNKDEYLTRPDLGRILSEEAISTIKSRCKAKPQVQVVAVDGLSSKAIEANIGDFLPALLQGLKSNGLECGTPFFVRYGRVAIMDHIGEVLEPEVVVEMVGERPGLVTAESMSCYMCYRPRKSTVESERMLISNIYRGGLPPAEAGAHAASIARKIFDARASGLNLQA
ncbi:MAG: ethanolamine ammonia-lyase subunit EutC [Firmicutes bacterium]|nr:ethanolamine ammonia-lyase subunit EutC [Bacillota bacterium]